MNHGFSLSQSTSDLQSKCFFLSPTPHPHTQRGNLQVEWKNNHLKKAEGKCYVCGKQVFPDTVDHPLNIKYTELVSILNNQKTSEGVQKHLIEHCL